MRITPTPGHSVEQEAKLIEALDSIWKELNLNRTEDWKRLGGRAGVGVPAPLDSCPVGQDRIWTDEQLGLVDGSHPTRIGRDVKRLNLDSEGHLSHQQQSTILSSEENPVQFNLELNPSHPSFNRAPAASSVSVQNTFPQNRQAVV